MKLSARVPAARAGTAMAVGSMACVQVGLAVTVPLFGQIGPLGAVWLRLAWAAVILLVVIRPRPWRCRRPAAARHSHGAGVPGPARRGRGPWPGRSAAPVAGPGRGRRATADPPVA